MKLTIEEFNTLNEIEDELNHSVKENYFRIVNRPMLAEYAKIYKRVFRRDSKIVGGCGHCVLQDMRQLAYVYFDDKKEMEEAAKQAQNKPIDLIQPECATTATVKAEKPSEQKKSTKTATKNKKK